MRQDEGQGAGVTLGNFVAAASWADVASQSHEAKRSILNFFATALCSAYDPAVTSALRALSPFSGAATSAVVGRPSHERTLHPIIVCPLRRAAQIVCGGVG